MSDDDKLHQIESERALRRAQQVADELTDKMAELNQLLAIINPRPHVEAGEHERSA